MAERAVTLVPYDPSWPARFTEEAERLRTVLPGEVVAVHHVGSTAVPGLRAKPTIDVLLEVRSLDGLDARRPDAERAGYRWLGENGIPGRRYLVAPGAPGAEDRAHVHAFEQGHAEVARHVGFRDYLIAHPERAGAYARLKAGLARAHVRDRAAYVDGKAAFIRETDALARAWRRGEAG